MGYSVSVQVKQFLRELSAGWLPTGQVVDG